MSRVRAQTGQPPPRRNIAARGWRALRLDPSFFAEAAADRGALVQAGLVVVAGGLGRGLGAFPEEGWVGLLGSPVVGILVWLVGALLIWGIARARLGHALELPALLRAVGFAAAPFVALPACALVPSPWDSGLWVLLHAWGTLALAIAVREAFGISTRRALALCLLVLGVTLALLFVAGLVLVGGSVAC